MADGEKLNVDSIIQRLLEGLLLRDVTIGIHSKIYRGLNFSLEFQCVAQDQERMYSLQREKSEGCASNQEKSF